MSAALKTASLLCVLAFGVGAVILGMERMPEWLKGVSQIVFGASVVLWSLDRLIEPKEKQR